MMFCVNIRTLVKYAQKLFKIIATLLAQTRNLDHIAVMGQTFDETLLFRQQFAGHQLV